MLVKRSGSAPLDKITAHHAHNGRVSAQLRPALGKMVIMAQVKGIKFAYNTNYTHPAHLPLAFFQICGKIAMYGFLSWLL
jgi:hypothetical protein